MGELKEIEIWVTMDEDGDYAVAKDGDDIDGAGDSENLTARRRVVCIKATMRAPTHQILTCTIPDTNDEEMIIEEVKEDTR